MAFSAAALAVDIFFEWHDAAAVIAFVAVMTSLSGLTLSIWHWPREPS
jgi:hypothetical protein